MKILTIPQAEDLLLEVDKHYSLLSNLQPVNHDEEKKKFFEAKYNYNPTFTYKIKDYSEIESKLNDISVETSDIGNLYSAKFDRLRNVFKLIKSIGNNDEVFVQICKEIYGLPNSESIAIAERIMNLSKESSPSLTMMSYEEIKKTLENEISKSGLDFKIKEKESFTNNFHVDSTANTIYIPKDKVRSTTRLYSAIRHEIYTHLLRVSNGRKQEYKIFYLATANYLPTEEGLATIMGHTRLENELLVKPARLLLAIQAASESDFKTTFNTIYKLTKKPNLSWSITFRVKRGLGDTSKSGAFSKDLYLKWAIELGRKILKNTETLNYIFNGKASVEELSQFTNPADFSHLLNTKDISNLFNKNTINE